ncbi:MAG: hypothetical protein MJ089_00395 [Ruminococcus sp.]|nr:hypothetical protein [Ruminococcus sp.]
MISAEYNQYLVQVSNVFKSRNFYLSRISSLIKEKNNRLSYINQKRHSILFSYSVRIALIVIFTIVGLFLVPYCRSSLMNKDYLKYFLYLFLIVAFSVLDLIALIFIIYKIVADIVYKNKSNKYRKEIKEIDTYIDNIQTKLNIETQKIIEYNILPEAYWYAGDVIINYVLNMRADNFKEAINLFEIELQNNIQFHQQMQMLQSIRTQVQKNANKTVRVFVC